MKELSQDEKFMKKAYDLAMKAYAQGDVPIGCVIVQDGKVIASGYNRRRADGSVLAHAEIIAIKKACKKLKDWRLEGCSMYVTLEPCQMCAGALVQSRIDKVYIGAMNPKAGCAGSIINLFNIDAFNHKIETEIGVYGEECSQMLSSFFKELRAKKFANKENEGGEATGQ